MDLVCKLAIRAFVIKQVLKRVQVFFVEQCLIDLILDRVIFIIVWEFLSSAKVCSVKIVKNFGDC